MSEITHFSHEHPLILRKQFPKSDVDGYGHFCYFCGPSSSGEEKEEKGKHEDAYVCELCKKFFLHKTCAELPRQIIHKSHERHPLVLSQKSTEDDRCHLCSEGIINSVCYNCDICMFHMHLRCALREKRNVIDYDDKSIISLNHRSHEAHSLTLFSRPAAVLCDACDDKDEDFFYHCLPCRYQIHRRCALLPTTIYHKDDIHCLSLFFDFPSEHFLCLPSEYRGGSVYYCHVCRKEIRKNQQGWVYCCISCEYFVHIKCMVIQRMDFNDAKKVFLPTSDDIATDLIKPFLLGDKEPDNIQEIQIFSHKQHPLVLCLDEITEDVIEDDEEILCDGCTGPIFSPPYYCCAQCRYFLHLCCANLPKIILIAPRAKLRSKSRYYEYITCNICEKCCNGFYYELNEYFKYCCISCAAIDWAYDYSFTYMHVSHDHALAQPELYILNMTEAKCQGCNGPIDGRYTLSCPSCKFYLHYNCMMLPRSTRHRYDSKHPLILKFPPHLYHEDPFDCAECEKEIDRRFWLFHCEECDLSFHTECINDTRWRFKFGQKLQIPLHSHPLRFVSRAAVKSPCNRCGDDIHLDLAFECQTCNFHLCRNCVIKMSI